ncbi:MAG: malonate decarboxylase subunit alpha, partial [Betaproteobacteria bacterium]|nr:malonate decarboxylase subunit alpha [Betaproteobacteria bacterium]
MNAPDNSRSWNQEARRRAERLSRSARWRRGKEVAATDMVSFLEAVLAPGDRVCLEGNNQKQADFLAASLAACSPQHVHDLHLVQSVLALPEHMELFE